MRCKNESIDPPESTWLALTATREISSGSCVVVLWFYWFYERTGATAFEIQHDHKSTRSTHTNGGGRGARTPRKRLCTCSQRSYDAAAAAAAAADDDDDDDDDDDKANRVAHTFSRQIQ